MNQFKCFIPFLLILFVGCGKDQKTQLAGQRPEIKRKAPLKGLPDSIETEVLHENQKRLFKQISWQGQPLYDQVLSQFILKFAGDPFLSEFQIDSNSYYLYKEPEFSGEHAWQPKKIISQHLDLGKISIIDENQNLVQLQRNKDYNYLDGLDQIETKSIILHQAKKTKGIFILKDNHIAAYPLYENLTLAQNLQMIDRKIEFNETELIFFDGLKQNETSKWHWLNNIELDDLVHDSIYLIYANQDKLIKSSKANIHLSLDQIHELEFMLSQNSAMVIEQVQWNSPESYSQSSHFDCQISSGIRRKLSDAKMQLSHIKEYLSETYLNVEGRVQHIENIFDFDRSYKINGRIIIPIQQNFVSAELWEFSFTQTTTLPVTVALASRSSGSKKNGCSAAAVTHKADIKYQELRLSIY